ncbi:hypothetical protein CsSME_00034861 [Camellia sinensis var. sinensis]
MYAQLNGLQIIQIVTERSTQLEENIDNCFKFNLSTKFHGCSNYHYRERHNYNKSKFKDYRSIATSLKFQSLTMSLRTAQLLTSRGVPATPLFGILGCGVTLDDDAIEVFLVGYGRDTLLVKQFAIAEHLPSLSELETE